MLVIFGGQKTQRDEGPVVTHACRRCDKETAWHLHTVTDWLAIFLIRVTKLGTMHYLQCSVCGDGLALNAVQDALIRKGDANDDATITSWITSYQRAGRTGSESAAPRD